MKFKVNLLNLSVQLASKQKLQFEELLAAFLVIFYSVNDRNSHLIAKITG